MRSEAILRAAETISRQYARASMGPLQATGYGGLWATGYQPLLPRPSAIPAGTNSRHPELPPFAVSWPTASSTRTTRVANTRTHTHTTTRYAPTHLLTSNPNNKRSHGLEFQKGHAPRRPQYVTLDTLHRLHHVPNTRLQLCPTRSQQRPKMKTTWRVSGLTRRRRLAFVLT